MTQQQKDRNWRRLCGGKKIPPPAPKPVIPPDPVLLHPERLTDPHWAWKPFKRNGLLDRLRATGKLDEAKLAAHFAACDRQPNAGLTAHTP